MSHLQHYLNRKNAFCEILNTEPTPYPETKEQVNALIEDVECDLSPENLTCDGESSREQVQHRLNYLHGVQAELNRILETFS